MNNDQFVTVRMTKEHALAVIHGLEMYERVALGHWQYVVDDAAAAHGILWGPGVPEARMLAAELRKALTPDLHPNSNKGISNVTERAKLTYEVQGQMQQAIARDQEQWSVWKNGALNLSGKPLPTAAFGKEGE